MLQSTRQLLRKPSSSSRPGPLVMGILNVTPDSFSDGGKFIEVEVALVHAKRMIDDGADIIDIGPESTRPGADSVSADQQCARAIPIIKRLRALDDSVTISIDTRIANVAEAAISAGADWINDVSAMRDDPGMVQVAADTNAPVILMHMRGCPADMQANDGPSYDDVIKEICEFLQERIAYAESCGVDSQRIIVDPGIGFGKRTEHNLAILREVERLKNLGRPVLIGASRKRFIGSVLSEIEIFQHINSNDRQSLDDRLAGSLAAATIAAMNGAAILRVHDVRETVAALAVVAAIENRGAVD